MPNVTIAIPTYNHARYLPEAIESALGQSRAADEILIVDNGSTDETPDIAARYPGIRYIRQRNQGICGSSNRAFIEAKGDLVVLLHSDDRLLPNHVEASLRGFRDRPDAGFVCGDYRWFGAENLWHVHQCAPNPDYYGTLLRMNFIGPPVVIMFRRDIVLRVGGFNPAYVGADDQELYLRIARSHPIHCHHEVVAEYRRHEGQGSKQAARMLKASMAMMRAQRPHVAGRPAHLAAYREGIRYRRALYRDTLLWQGVAAARAGSIRDALRCAGSLLRHDPAHLMGSIWRRATRPLAV